MRRWELYCSMGYVARYEWDGQKMWACVNCAVQGPWRRAYEVQMTPGEMLFAPGWQEVR